MHLAIALAPLDWGVLIAFLVGTLAVGVVLSRRARASTESYFKGGGGLPWWLLGTSIVATTFAADTPLAISGFVLTEGISANWFWWCQVPMVMAGVFFFAQLWRRANPMTDMEFLDQRYSGREARFLRGFKAAYLALPYGCLVMGWVNKAMAKILGMVFPDVPRIPGVDALLLSLFLATPLSQGLSPEARVVIENGRVDVAASVEQIRTEARQAERLDEESVLVEVLRVRQTVNEYKILFALFLFCLLYTVISGLWGVVVTDFIQFWVAMGGCIFLAWSAIEACGGMAGLNEQLVAIYGIDKSIRMTAILPVLSGEGGGMALLRFLLFVMVAWWAVGFTDGGSYHAQRLLAAKDERHAALGYLWFGVANYALRFWPWVLTGLAAAVLFPYVPGESDPEGGFIKVMLSVLGPGWLGLLVATFFAAYMSTISTQLNLGASYLVNDLYRPFLVKGRTDRHYLRAGMAMTVLMAAGGIFVSFFLTSIADAWLLLAAMNAGIGVIYILRWYWWRISAWSEIACLGAAVVLTPLTVFSGRTLAFLRTSLKQPDLLQGIDPYMTHPYTLLYAMPLCLLAAFAVTLKTRPVEREKLREFCERVNPGGPGWRTIEAELTHHSPNPRPASPLTRRNFVHWGLATASVYAFLVGIGWLVMGDLPRTDPLVPARVLAVVLLGGGTLTTGLLVRSLMGARSGDRA